jgi:excisionase family DNA binding protein
MPLKFVRASHAKGPCAPTDEGAPLLSVAQVAERLRLCSKTVRRRIAEGGLPVHRIGRSLRISEADLGDFLARSR